MLTLFRDWSMKLHRHWRKLEHGIDRVKAVDTRRDLFALCSYSEYLQIKAILQLKALPDDILLRLPLISVQDSSF